MNGGEYDVTVIGAGLAGLVTARILAVRGHRVLLADHKDRVDQGITTTGIFVRRTLEDFRIPADCLGLPLRTVVLHSPGGRRISFQSSRDEFRVARMTRLYQRLLDDARCAGVTWMPGVHYLSSLGQDGGSTVQLRRQTQLFTVRTRVLVGADGAVSKVAFDLGLDRNSAWLVGVEDVLRGVQLPGGPAMHCFLDSNVAPGYLAWLVHDGQETHLGVGGDPNRFDPRAALEQFRRRVGTLFDLKAAVRVERRGGRIPVNGILRRIGCERGLLVGDAAGAVSPLTAGGLDPCYRLSAHAAGVIDQQLQDSWSIAEHYSGSAYQARVAGRRALRWAWHSMANNRVIEVLVTLLQVPGFRHLARNIFFGRGSFPDARGSIPADPLFRFPTLGESHHERHRHPSLSPAGRRVGRW